MMLYPRVSLYALMLAAAGIPLYIHLPQFASVNLGISLGTIGVILLVIRLIDLVQDPLIGWAIDRWPGAQAAFGLTAAAGLAVGFPLLFSLTPGPYLVTKLILILILLFSAYSLGSILLYGRSATLAKRPDEQALMTLASFREGGMLAGVIIAALAPAVFVGLGALRLLVLALVNSLPVAITSTLFLFFVEDRLQLPGMAGPLLTLFFLSAGLSVPLWTRVSQRLGAKRTLLISMPMAIAGFVGAAFLGQGDMIGFAVICVAAGAALGSDTVLLPAMFSVALTKAGLKASLAFGIWAFAGKLGLALAAFIVMPLLQWNGFQPGQVNTAQALTTLSVAYAVIPCVLKLGSLALVLTLPDDRLVGRF